MAGRRSCVNSLWSGTERVRIGERLKATLAGVLELELLRCKHLEMMDTAMENRVRVTAADQEAQQHEEQEEVEEEKREDPERTAVDTEQGSATSRRQQVVSTSDAVLSTYQSSPEDSGAQSGDGAVYSTSARGSHSRWSTLSWDAPSDLLSPPTPDPGGMVHVDSDSRPSSGFYSVSGSSLSDSCYSVSSEAAQGGGAAPPAKPLKLWEQALLSTDNTDILWSEGVTHKHQQEEPLLQTGQEDVQPTEEVPLSGPKDQEVTGLSFLSDLCSGQRDSLIQSLLQLLDPTSSSSTPTPHSKPQLDPRYCTDLVSRRTKEVYSYPSPLHAVALQSPLFTSPSPEQSASLNLEGLQNDEPAESKAKTSIPLQPQHSAATFSVTQLEQYISRLAHQYRNRVTSSTSDLSSTSISTRSLCVPGKSHGSTQSLSAFESRSTNSAMPGGSITPCKSLLGSSARVSLSTSGKKATRNSINLGNLPSATGEDLNINLHLNLNLNLTPGLNPIKGTVDNSKSVSCGSLRSDFSPAPSSSTSSIPSAPPAPALRARPRISTCPSSLNHRSSLEVTSGSGSTPGYGSSFCRSFEWTSGAPPEAGPSVLSVSAGSAPGSQRSSLIQESSSGPKLREDSPMVGEISRLSGLSRAVVVGLMEQGVELDIDCFQADAAGEVKSHGKSLQTAKADQSHDYTKLSNLNPQRPIQLSLSVTHSPQSQTSLTPPLSHSSSPIHPYPSIHTPSPHYTSHSHYQQIPSPSDLPSSTASSPASRPNPRNRSPPRPLQPSPLGATPLSVFRRDAPFQCSLPHTSTRTSSLEHGGIQHRGGSLRQSGEGSGGWKRAEGEGLYKGKHASHKLVRAATVSCSGKKEDYSSVWGEEDKEQTAPAAAAAHTPRRNSNKLWRGFEGRLWGKESEKEKEEMDRAEYGYGWRRNSVGSWRREKPRVKATSSSNDKRPKVDNSPLFLKAKGKEDGERRGSSLRLSRRALFRSESQGLLVPHNHSETHVKRGHWVSSLDVGPGVMSVNKDEGIRLLRTREGDKHLSSSASLFNLSHSQSLEDSCLSLSPLSSPSFSPSPPPRMPLQRSRSLKDLGRRMFGSMRSLSLKRKPSKK